ncbi:Exonuclease [Theobroma cacao]|nr:Exonuclease [Theobroma cacao]
MEEKLKPLPIMAFVNSTGIPVSRIFAFCSRSLSSPLTNPFFISTLPRVPSCKFSITAQFSPPSSSPSSSSSMNTQVGFSSSSSRWRPMCLYYTQGKCTKMDDPFHLEKFSHDCSRDLQVNATSIEKKCSQNKDFFLVLDLEGKVEILEFPVLLMDAKTLRVVDFFHRFVRPSEMSEQAINKYIEGKYGKFGVDRVWHDTAQPFKEVIQQFEAWLTQHQLWEKKGGGSFTQAAFRKLGFENKGPSTMQSFWDQAPPIFHGMDQSKGCARGMMSMMKQLEIPSFGSHHLGIDDTKNIARVLQHMLADGAVMQITARRYPESQKVEFHFENRVR